MRFLHTSDWHLGRSLHRADLRSAQAAFVDAIVETVRAESVDAVLVAGDVYDRAIPPLDAIELFEDALVRLRDAGATVVISSGNHDSAVRLGFGSRLIASAGIHLRTDPAGVASPIVLSDAHGPVGVYAVPYLEPDAVRVSLNPATPGHTGALTRATELIAADAAQRGLTRTVVTAHAWVTGGEASDSERDISVGGVARVPAALFGGFSYTALGHLHGPQAVEAHVRYSGSPLAYSFSEARQRKGWWLADLDAGGRTRVKLVAAPQPRRMSTLTGTLDDLLTSRAHGGREADFIAVTLTDRTRPLDPMERLRARFPHVLTVAWEPVGAVVDERSYRARVRGRDDLTVAQGFVEHVRHAPADVTETRLLQAAIEAARTADSERPPIPLEVH